MSKRLTKKFILSVVFVTGLLAVITNTKVYADCETEKVGTYGERIVCNKSFKITKQVRIEGDNDWEDKVTDVKDGDVIEFRVRIKNVGDIEVDDMKMKDILPDELIKVGGSGLTEYFDNFEPGETEEFVIKAEIKDSEFDRKDFEKCVVNKAEVYFGDRFEGSDTATVCYGKGKVTELPKTGPESTIAMSLAGLGFVVIGTLSRKKLA